MEEIMLSIRPEWCSRIAKGGKTLEVRKTKPKCELPIKCYIYCTAVKPLSLQEYVKIHAFTGGCIDEWNKKVMGEFTCCNISPIRIDNLRADCCLASGLSAKEISEYAGNRNLLWGWDITKLEIYQNAKELSVFGFARPPQSWAYLPNQMMVEGESR